MASEKNPFYPEYVRCVQARWPCMLIKQFTSMFDSLIAEAQISLERLQLVSLSVKQNQKNEGEASLVKDGDFVIATKTFTLYQNFNVECAVHFFMRGQRQYFRHNISPIVEIRRQVSAFSEEQISAFFSTMNQANSALYDKGLAHLLGRSEVMVPSQMLVALCLEYALDVEASASAFDLRFLRAISVGEPISIGHYTDSKKMIIELYADFLLAVQVVVD